MGEIDDIRAGRWDRRILGEDDVEVTEAPIAKPEVAEEVRPFLSSLGSVKSYSSL